MRVPGVYSTQVGYAGGTIENPSYQDVCTGATNHNEVVRVIYDPEKVTYSELLKSFWEKHVTALESLRDSSRDSKRLLGSYDAEPARQ